MEAEYSTNISNQNHEAKMTEIEYMNSGCENRHALFTFSNGEEVSGVITTFFFDEPNKYYLVRTPDLIEFKKYMDTNDLAKMKLLCALVDLRTIVDVESMEAITFTIRANIAFQRITYDYQSRIQNILQQIINDSEGFLRRQSVVKIKEHPYYVIRVDEGLRLLIQKKKYGIIVNDILFGK